VTAASTTRPGGNQDGAAAARLFELRTAPVQELAGQAAAVAEACHAMAVRFHQGGKLIVFGTGGPSTDAQHVAVEFVHPVIVGTRALPAISLTTDVATVTGVAARFGLAEIFAHQIRYLAAPEGIALYRRSGGQRNRQRSGGGRRHPALPVRRVHPRGRLPGSRPDQDRRRDGRRGRGGRRRGGDR
jgi:hypothetical protein